MGLLDSYFDPETLAAIKTMNQPSPGQRSQALNSALLTTGLGMLMNNRGDSRGQALGNAIGRGGMMGMGAYQQSIDDGQKDQSQSLQMAMALSKMKKDQEAQEAIRAGVGSLFGGQPQYENKLTDVTLDPSNKNGTRLDMSAGTEDRDKYASWVSSYESNLARGMKPTPDQQAAYQEIKGRVQPVYTQVEKPRDISGGLRQLGTTLMGTSPEVAKGFLQAADSYRPDYAQVDTGNGVQFVDKRGSVPAFIQKGMSPEAVASNRIAMQRLGLDSSKFGLDQQQFEYTKSKDNGPQWDAGSGQFVIKPTSDNPTGRAVTPQGGAGKPLTETQGKAYGFADRMASAEKILNDPKTVEQPSAVENLAGALPLVGDYAANQSRSAPRQQYFQAQQDWVRAKLRLESGAVIGKDEMEAEIKTYFPQQGDSPELIAQKAAARKTALDATAKQAGNSYQQTDAVKPRSKQFKLDDGKSVIGQIGEDGNYYVTRGGKKYRVEE